jgi:hypothetical protein
MGNQWLGVTLSVALLSPAVDPTASPSPGDRALQTIEREARHEITLLPHYSLFDWIEFDAQLDGTVTLSGQVVGLTLRADAEQAIKRIAGVSAVVNRIEPLPESAATTIRATLPGRLTETGRCFTTRSRSCRRSTSSSQTDA